VCCLDFPLQHLEPETRPAYEESKAGEREPINEKDVPHTRVKRTTAPDHRLWVLRTEEPDRKIDKRHI
jgi:hypothetical protein